MDLSSRINYRFFFLHGRGKNKGKKEGGVRGMEMGIGKQPSVFLTGMIERRFRKGTGITPVPVGDICPWKQSIGD